MVFLAVLSSALACLGQASPDVEQGMKPYGSYHGGAIDSVSLTNGNVTLQAGLMTYSQRGGGLAYPIVLRYNGKNFSTYQEACTPNAGGCPLRIHVLFGPNPLRDVLKSEGNSVTIGFEGFAGIGTGLLDSSLSFNGNDVIVNPASAYTTDGAVHQLATTNHGLVALDGSGFASSAGSLGAVDRNGTISSFAVTALDRHGNQVSTASDGSASVDTLGRHIPLAPGPAPSIATPPASTASLSGCPALNYAFQPATYAYTWNLPTVSGSVLPLTLCYTGVYVRTGAGTPAPPVFQVSQNFYMLQSVVLPDNTYWAFQYDAADPNNTSSVAFGDLLKVTFPTGGSITYTWALSNMGCSSGFDRAVQTRTVDANDGSGPHTWKYNSGVVTDPLGNDTVHVITALGNNLTGGASCSFYETQTRYYQGSQNGGTLLKTVNTDYQYTFNPYDPSVIGSGGAQSAATTVINVFPIRVTTTLPNGLVSKVETDYDNALAYHGPLDGITWNVNGCPSSGGGGAGHTKTYPPFDNPPTGVGCWVDQQTNGVTNYTGSYGKPVAVREYDWGQGGPGPLLRQTLTTYQWQVNSAYLTANLLDLPAKVQVLDGAGNQVALTAYGYDESTPASSGVTTQLAAAPWSVRGNLTSTHHWLNTNNSTVTISSTYFDTGEEQSSTDPLGHTTTHSYDPAYAGAYPTQTCSPQTGSVTHCVSGTYDFNSGMITSFTDQNHQTSNFSYDPQWRMTQALGPVDPVSGLRPETDFDHSVVNQVKRTKKINGSTSVVDYAYFDGVGRPRQGRLVDPAGDDFVDTTYDALGHVSTVSNPHRSTASPTDGITTSLYDALGRVAQVTKQDGSISSVDYSAGNCTTTTDEAGKQRRACSDALGRLAEVDEPGVVAGHVANNSLAMQSDGNLVVYSPTNQPLWSTGTAGSNATGFEMQDDGNLVLYTFRWSAGTYVWPPPPGPFPPADCSIGINLNAPQVLPSGKCITSPKRQYLLYMPPDGNLFIYDIAHNVGTWGAATGGHPGAYAVLQTDGNFVVYTADGQTALWSSGTNGTNAQRLEMSDDGRIIIYRSVWSSGTSRGVSAQTLPHPACDLGTGMGQGGWLGTGQCFVSFNGQYELLMQTDGNLVINDLSVSPPQTVWSTNTGLTPFSPAVALRTLYSYDALDNLLCVEQHGDSPSGPHADGTAGTGCSADPSKDANSTWRVRRFTYDSLSRLLAANNPESGLISYFYDANGNLLQKVSPAPNQKGTATHTISYAYDALNRVTGKAYSWQNSQNGQLPPGTAVVSYTYDDANVPNGIGRLTKVTDQAGSGNFSYDPLGRMSGEQRTIAGVTKSMSYTYNLDGSVATATYPSGATITYTPDATGRMLKAVDSANNINYVTGATYGPDGALRGFVSGQSNSFGGITNIFIYNNRLQPCRMAASSAGAIPTNCMNSWGNVLDLSYDFHLGNGDNGNVYAITNYRDQTRNQTFTYDPLNRLLSAQNAGTDCNVKVLNNVNKFWGNTYTYDAWGNLTHKTLMTSHCSGENLSATVDTSNRLQSPYDYDAAGNMIHDATANLNYTFDQENRIVGAAGFTYTYDSDGNRVEKANGSAGTIYWYMTLGIVGESDLAGNLKSEYVFFDGERVARKDFPGNTVSYYFSDHLKTASVITDSAGNIKSESDYYPWGGELQITNNDSNHYKFTGKERDSESGLDYFGARHYSNGLGRFITPDWAAKPVAIPYAVLGDPQTLNLYTYVRNIPTTTIDPDGHDGAGLLNLVSNAEVSALMQQVGRKITLGFAAAGAAGTALGLEAKSFIDAHANNLQAAATLDMVHQQNLNQVIINNSKQQLGHAQGADENKSQSDIANERARTNGGFAYENPGHHDPISPNFVPGKTPLPTDAEAVFNHGVVHDSSGAAGTGQKAFGISDKGEYYRYTGQNNRLHFSGKVAPKNREIRKQLQQQLKERLKAR